MESHRGHPLLVYVTSKREGIDASMATNALPYMIDQLDALPPETRELDILIASSPGGQASVSRSATEPPV
jgi:hypothetical protein